MHNLLISIKKFIWELTFGNIYRYRYWRTLSIRKKLHVLNSIDTVQYIIKNNSSVARFGDGEFQMITHYKNHDIADNFHVDSFQPYSSDLACRLLEVFSTVLPNLLVCIPYAFKDSSVQKGYQRIFFEREWLLRKEDILNESSSNRIMGDACFTRFYFGRKDIADYCLYVKLLKKIWNRKKLLIVEGEQSRLGIGNDLFDNALEIHRILCPAVDAFAKYDQIFSAVQKITKDTLVLIALGHTATVLAYDLSIRGYQAIDIGHLDIEYEWMRMRAKRKIAVPNKYVNECNEGRIDTSLDDPVYLSQIIERIR